MKLPSNFSRDVPYFIKELEIISGVKKHFEKAPRRSNLDDWFFKKQELFKVDTVGIYFDKTKTNIQCYDLDEGIELLKNNIKTADIYAFYIFCPYGLKITGHVDTRKAEIPADEAYMLGWQMLHLLEAVHSCGLVFNGMQFDKIIFTELRKKVEDIREELSFREKTISFNNYSLVSPYIDSDTKQHIKKKKLAAVKGDMLFKSLDSINFQSPSRRDDLIGLA